MLRQRVLTAIVLIPPGLAAVWLLPSRVFSALIAVIMIVGAWEWTALMRLQAPAMRILYVLLVAALMFVGYLERMAGQALHTMLAITLAWWCLALVWVLSYPAVLVEGRQQSLLKGIVGLMLLCPAFLAIAVLHEHAGQGPLWILFLLLMIWAADTGAYFSGRAFGRYKMAARVSPGKTWEGAIGGLLLSTLVSIGAGFFLFQLRGQGLMLFVPMCFMVAVFSIVGDLTESMFKRHAGVKDSGALFPGHGGVLDRFDSMLAAAPLFLAGLLALGL